MGSGGFCGDYGGKITRDRLCLGEGTIYHRRTHICQRGQSVKIVKSSENPWIALQGKEIICFVTCGILQEEKRDLFKIFSPLYNEEPTALVSAVLRTSEVHDGCGIAVSFAEFNEKVAINYLRKILRVGTFTIDEKQTAVSAFKLLCPGSFKANEIKFYAVRKDNKITKPLPSNKTEGLSNVNTQHTCKRKSIESIRKPDVYFQESESASESESESDSGSDSESERESKSYDSMSPDARMTTVTVPFVGIGCESTNTSHKKSRSRISYNHETQIWCGGWDSRLLKNSDFSWIGMQGKDSICVVTRDEVTLGKGFLENALSHMKDIQASGMKGFADQMSKKSFVMRPCTDGRPIIQRSVMRPFAAVSVVVGFDEVHEGSGHEASSAEIMAIEFLMKNIKKASDFTYAGTIQTAISALVILTQKNLNPEEIKACVWREGEYRPAMSKLPMKEIEDHLRVIYK